MRFEKCMGILGGLLYEIWKVCGDPRGSSGEKEDQT